MARQTLFLAAALLGGCQTPFGFGGEDWEDNVDDPFDTQGAELTDTATGDSGGPRVIAAHAWCAEGDPAGLATFVTATDVWVTHVGFSDECTACAAWDVSALSSGTDVTVTYTDLDADTCDCDCGQFAIEYVMTGFTTGRWTLAAGDDATSFDVGLVTE